MYLATQIAAVVFCGITSLVYAVAASQQHDKGDRGASNALVLLCILGWAVTLMLVYGIAQIDWFS